MCVGGGGGGRSRPDGQIIAWTTFFSFFLSSAYFAIYSVGGSNGFIAEKIILSQEYIRSPAFFIGVQLFPGGGGGGSKC